MESSIVTSDIKNSYIEMPPLFIRNEYDLLKVRTESLQRILKNILSFMEKAISEIPKPKIALKHWQIFSKYETL